MLLNTDYNVAIEGSFTALSQFTGENRVENAVSACFDLLSKSATESGEWIIYVKGNKSPRKGGVYSVPGGANTDSGLDSDGKRRLQVSEVDDFTAMAVELPLANYVVDIGYMH